ncbi:MAG: chloride channel protein [Tepidisphaeraceae bacterium]
MILTLVATRLKVLGERLFAKVGMKPDIGLIPIAGLIGLLTAIASVTFHELIKFLQHRLFTDRGLTDHGDWLYGHGIWLLVVIPAAGGLLVGLIGKALRVGEGGHGMVDVIESVIRTRGFVKPIAAVEKILTSALTIGTGGSAGAEGPIVQIGAAISSGVGSALSVSRHRMPLLVGCGTAAGISSIFHCPIGGVIFTLEVILRDFSARTFAPVVVASVVANLATYGVFQYIEPNAYQAIFAMPSDVLRPDFGTTAMGMIHAVILGLLCGVIGVAFTKTLLMGEHYFHPLRKLGAARPALGGALLGLLGVGYVMVFGWMLHQPKPVPFHVSSGPAFFADGYSVIRSMLDGSFAQFIQPNMMMAMLLALIVLKIFGTMLTLGSGGSGGIIAPSLFLGAAAGQLLGAVLPYVGGHAGQGQEFALVGMGACLGAVVHAPLASILILFELTLSPGVIVPAMLATITAHGIARMVMADSIYTLTLRERGLSPEAQQDMSLLRKYTIDHLKLEPIVPLMIGDPAKRAIDLAMQNEQSNFVIVDEKGGFRGMLTETEIRQMLLAADAIPLMTVGEVMRSDIRPVRHTENLASLFDEFLRYDVDALPIGLDYDPNRTIGIATRDGLLKYYHTHLNLKT